MALYARPGVAEALIALQDRLGIDVNVVLYCLWRIVTGRGLAHADIDRAAAVGEAWQAGVVRSLREVRRRLKAEAGPPSRLYAAIKRVELAAEHVEQRRLAALAARPHALPPSDCATLARAALAYYVSKRGRRMGAADRRAVDRIVAAATGK